MQREFYLPPGFTKTPWGHIATKNGLVRERASNEINERIELGEFAIRLLGLLGVDEATIQQLQAEEDPLAALTRLKGG